MVRGVEHHDGELQTPALNDDDYPYRVTDAERAVQYEELVEVPPGLPGNEPTAAEERGDAARGEHAGRHGPGNRNGNEKGSSSGYMADSHSRSSLKFKDRRNAPSSRGSGSRGNAGRGPAAASPSAQQSTPTASSPRPGGASQTRQSPLRSRPRPATAAPERPPPTEGTAAAPPTPPAPPSTSLGKSRELLHYPLHASLPAERPASPEYAERMDSRSASPERGDSRSTSPERIFPIISPLPSRCESPDVGPALPAREELSQAGSGSPSFVSPWTSSNHPLPANPPTSDSNPPDPAAAQSPGAARPSSAPPRSRRAASGTPLQSGWGEGSFISHSLQVNRYHRDIDPDEYFRQYKLGRHKPETPDFKFSQPRAQGPQGTLKQMYWSFDEAHPALAEQHCKRTKEQERMLVDERCKAQRKQLHQDEKMKRERMRSGVAKSVASGSGIQQRTQEALAAAEKGSQRGRVRMARGRPAVASDEARWREQEQTIDDLERRVRQLQGAMEPALVARTRRLQQEQQGQQGEAAHAILTIAREQAAAGSKETAEQQAPLGKHQGHDDGARKQEADESIAAAAAAAEPELQGEAEQEGGEEKVEAEAGVKPTGAAEELPATPAEMAVATAAWTEEGQEEFNRQVDEEMQRRAQEGAERGDVAAGYESDVDREEFAERIAKEREVAAALQAAGGDPEEEEKATWKDQNEWMDFYRQQVAQQAGCEAGYVDFEELHGPGDLYRVPLDMLTNEDEQRLNQAFIHDMQDVPLAFSDNDRALRTSGSPSPGPGYSSDAANGAAVPLRGRRFRKPFRPTRAEAPAFEERARQRPKPISQVKLEQMLEIQRMEEEAAYNFKFKANRVPSSNRPGLYEQILADEDARRKFNTVSRKMELEAQMEKPFSFTERDNEKAEERSRRAAKDPNRFQVKFKAKPAPQHVKEEKYREMLASAEARKQLAKERAGDLLKRSSMPPRMQEGVEQLREKQTEEYKEKVRAKLDKMRHVDPGWNKKHPSRKLGQVPDFDALHADWERRLQAARTANRLNCTVPDEFVLGGGTKEVREARESQAQQRRNRVLLDMLLDEEELPEQRWPFVSKRAKVHSTPPPAYPEPDLKVSDTKAAKLRARATQKAKEQGQYDSQAEKDARLLMEKHRETKARAQRWVRMQQAKARTAAEAAMHAALQDPGDLIPTADDSTARPQDQTTTSSTRGELEGMLGAPVGHVEARHRQAEAEAKAVVEEALLQQGLDAYKYVEGLQDPHSVLQEIAADMPSRELVRSRVQQQPESMLRAIMQKKVNRPWPQASKNPYQDAVREVTDYVMNYVV